MTCRGREGVSDAIFLVRNTGGITVWDEGKGIEQFWLGLFEVFGISWWWCEAGN